MTEGFLEEVGFRLGFGRWVRFRDAEEGERRNIRKVTTGSTYVS